MSLRGSVRDKARLAKAFGSEVETAVIKATSHEPVSPKLKHLECSLPSLPFPFSDS